MKKQLLSAATLLVFGLSSMFAQNNNVVNGKQLTKSGTLDNQNIVRCGAPIPSDSWDKEFNKLVEKFVQEHTDATGKVNMPSYTIPVIFHIIHNQNTVTQENINALRVTEQLNVLNADYAGTNTDISSVPTPFQGVKAGNTGIQFCLAVVDPSGATLAEPGIHRQKWNTISGATDPAAAADATALQTLFDGTIKPATIWNPVQYLNIWVCKATNSGLLGYASWPAAAGFPGGQLGAAETASTSGVVLNYQAVGTSGTAAAPYNKGRTATHEIGHWLGLRHISGDASCGNDFCGDTPLQKGGFSGGQGGLNWGCPTYPYVASGECSGTTAVTGGEMFMNYMDYVDDACMYMFSANQGTRMQTAMANGTYRKFLGTHGKCNTTPTAPTSSFVIASTGCTGTAVSTTNNSSGTPSPTYVWSTNPTTGVTISSSTATAPTITFANAGSYTVTLVATNGTGNNSSTQVISINTCAFSVCDTLMNLNDTNSLVLYTSTTGYVSGNNNYGDTHKAEYYTLPGISGANVTGAIAYFFKNGNNGTGGNATGTLAFEVYTGNNTTGPATVAKTQNVTLGTISTNGVQNGTVLAYSHVFTTPYTLTANEFLIGIKLPTVTGDTAALYSGLFDVPTTNTAWEKNGTTWAAYSTAGASWGSTASLALFPVVCPASVGLAASELNNQVSIFPNPSTGVINFAFALSNQSDVKIEVTNMLGQSVYSSIEKGISANVKSINIGDVSKGVYMVTVSTSTDKLVRKIVIE